MKINCQAHTAKHMVADIVQEYLELPHYVHELEDVAIRSSVCKLLPLAEKCLKDETQPNENVLSKSISEVDLLIQYVWEHLNVGHWKSVSAVWRKIYSYLHLFKIIFLVSLEEVSLQELTKLCDLSLLIGDTIPGNVIPRLASTFHKMQFINKNSTENTENNTTNKVPDDQNFPCGEVILKNQSANQFTVSSLCKPSLETFSCSHMSKEVPVKLFLVICHWPALKKWNPEYICQTAGCRTVPVEVGSKYTSEEWTQKLMTLDEFVAKYMTPKKELNTEQQPEPIGYIAQHQLFDQIPELKQDIHIPEYCFLGQENSVDINAWFGPAGTISPTHYDPKHNLLAQVFGRKIVRLFPPSESKILRPFDSNSLLNNTSQIDMEDPELFQKWPEMANASYADVILEPGSILYIPPKWWHFVKSLSPSFSVSFWFN